MEEKINILNEYLSNLKVENDNLYNLHFNVIGSSFMGLHKKLQEYYEHLALFYDDIAERIKMLNGYPITSLNKMEEISTIKSMKSMDFNFNQVLEILNNDFNFLVDYTKNLIKIFDDSQDYYTTNILNEILMYLEKELWMIKSTLK
ncbi:MAG: DNA starvation/stationary phase protection protein [Bacilli bacterium]|nr:DNA starvation/stationary phase protection protein [Bacilli bacterium]